MRLVVVTKSSLFLILYTYWLPLVVSLSDRNLVRNQRPIERVAIIGSGIAGLATAHALLADNEQKQQNIQVSLFDSRSAFNHQDGAGIQVNGGLAVLEKINPDVQRAVLDAGLPMRQIRTRAKPWQKEKTFDTLLDLDLEEVIRNAGEETSEALFDKDDQLLWCSIMRGALQEALVNTLPSDLSSSIGFGKKLSGLVANREDTTGGVTCKFQDGSTAGPFDLVIGCDGVKSAVKAYVEKGKISDDDLPGIYSGIRIRYAVQDGDDDSSTSQTKEEQGLTQYFADGAYGLHGVYGNGKDKSLTRCAFIVSQDDGYIGPFKKQSNEGGPSVSETMDPAEENFDWKQDNRENTNKARDLMLQQVKTCKIPDVQIGSTIANANRFFELGVYFHNPFSFSGWSKEVPGSSGAYAVLCGDAAHAMPPFLGQGANQAIQDAYCLATKIHEYNSNICNAGTLEEGDEQPCDLKQLFKEYENKRWAPTFSISAKSGILGYVETGGPDGVYAKFRDVFWRGMNFLGVPKMVLADTATPKV